MEFSFCIDRRKYKKIDQTRQAFRIRISLFNQTKTRINWPLVGNHRHSHANGGPKPRQSTNSRLNKRRRPRWHFANEITFSQGLLEEF